MFVVFFFFKQKTAYEMRISDWSSDVCSSDLRAGRVDHGADAVLQLAERIDAQAGPAISLGELHEIGQAVGIAVGIAAFVGQFLPLADHPHPFIVEEDRKSTRLNSSH